MVKWYNHWLIDWLIDNKAFTLDCRLNWKPFISWTRIRCHRLPYHRYLYSVSVLRNVIYRAMLCRAQCCHGKLIICLSVTLRYCCHIVWVSSKINYTYNESSVFTLGSSKGSIPKFQKLQSLKLYFSQLVLSLGGEHIRISGWTFTQKLQSCVRGEGKVAVLAFDLTGAG